MSLLPYQAETSPLLRARDGLTLEAFVQPLEFFGALTSPPHPQRRSVVTTTVGALCATTFSLHGVPEVLTGWEGVET